MMQDLKKSKLWKDDPLQYYSIMTYNIQVQVLYGKINNVLEMPPLLMLLMQALHRFLLVNRSGEEVRIWLIIDFAGLLHSS